MISTHIIIQARMGSIRLPGKVLKPFTGGMTFLEWIVKSCRTSKVADKVIVATTVSPKDDAIEILCKEKGYDYFRGSEDDVLARYAGAVQQYGSRIIVRVTSDNPLTDIGEIDRMVGILKSDGLDYADNRSPGLPIGTWSEAFTAKAFERVVAEAKDLYEHEHVTPYFYRYPRLFIQQHILPLSPHPFAPKARLTLDTPQDFEFFTQLAKGLGLSSPAEQPSTNDVLSYLESHPELVALNSTVT